MCVDNMRKVENLEKPVDTFRTWSHHSDSHADAQVPDLQNFLLDGGKHGGFHGGPLDVHHGPLGGDEAHHRLRLIPPPELDGPIRGAAQEGLVVEWRPGQAVDWTLTRHREKKFRTIQNEHRQIGHLLVSLGDQ